MKNIDDIIITIFVAAIFINAFLYDFDLVDSYHTAKILYLFLILGVLILTLSTIFLFSNQLLKISLNYSDVAILFYYLFILLRFFFTPNIKFDGYQFISLTLVLIVYFVIKILNKDENKLERSNIIITVFIITGLIQTIICLLQLYGFLPTYNSYFKITGTFGNPDALAGYLSSVVPFAFGYCILLSKDDIITKRIAFIFLILSILVIPASMIRNGWLAISAGIIYILYHKYKYKVRDFIANKVRTLLFGIFISMLILFVIYGLYSLKPDSANGRFLIWKISMIIVKNNPIFGIGFNRFGVDYGNYQAEYFIANPDNDYEKYIAGNVNHAHNDYLEIFCESGIIGLFLFLAILFFSLKTKSGKEDNITLISAKASLISISIFMLGSFPLHILPTAINYFFLLGLISSYKADFISFKVPKYIIRPVCILLIVSGVILIIYTFHKYFNYKKWQYTVNISYIGQYDEANKNFQELYPDLKDEGQFLLNYGGMLSLKGEHTEAIELLNEARYRYTDPNIYISLGNSYCALVDPLMAEKNYLHAYYIIPNRIYPLYLLTKMYFRFNMYAKGEEMGVKVLQFKEKVPSHAVDEIKSEIKELLNSRLVK